MTRLAGLYFSYLGQDNAPATKTHFIFSPRQQIIRCSTTLSHYALESTIWGGGEQTAASRMKVLEDDQLRRLKMDSGPEAVERQMLSGKRFARSPLLLFIMNQQKGTGSQCAIHVRFIHRLSSSCCPGCRCDWTRLAATASSDVYNRAFDLGSLGRDQFHLRLLDGECCRVTSDTWRT